MEKIEERSLEKETGRLEAFSDGVFAIAITLLVLELKVPPIPATGGTNHSLGKALLQQWPSYFSLATSFFTILIMWMHHHAIFRHVRRTDAWLHFVNGLLLLLITFVPFPTAVVALYLQTPAAPTAVAFYCATFVAIAIAFNLLLLAAFRPKLLAHTVPVEFAVRTKQSYLAGPPAYLLAMLAAFYSVRVSLTICTLLWIFWAATVTKSTRA
ncbi:MAG TPA: TMEM175 family protein [Candidatus Acidoferrum sp.]|jgi:uncharacterized membrane protein